MREKIVFAELNIVLKTATIIAVLGGISSCDMKSTLPFCLIAVPAAMLRTMSCWRGRPRATTGAVLVWGETENQLSSGEARPRARKPYWMKTSAKRRPMKRDVPRGEEALIRETLSCLSAMVPLMSESRVEVWMCDYVELGWSWL